ncbi:hypothetical protein [Euzebya tangerina]|uniref:hypothetical protein n=1 Tax=Euzebya tangerina TaxID=591198 RepID=UPI000E322BA8|nr:hypothetical protein [Euzebya tangerina]
MGSFAQRIISDDRIAVAPARVHEVLSTPEMLAELTPLVASIDVHLAGPDGDRWTWQLSGVNALGIRAAPSFTTLMDIGEQAIIFAPEPGTDERAMASGRIDVTAGSTMEETVVAIDLIATVELPLPQLARRAVKSVMFQTMKVGGTRFAENLLRHLGDPWHRGLNVRDPG